MRMFVRFAAAIAVGYSAASVVEDQPMVSLAIMALWALNLTVEYKS